MAMDPEFFVRRCEDLAETDWACAIGALVAAVDAALAPAPGRRQAAASGLRALREACLSLPPRLLAGMTFPLDVQAYLQCLEKPCATWLPLAREIGVEDARLLLFGLATPVCREIRQRYD